MWVGEKGHSRQFSLYLQKVLFELQGILSKQQRLKLFGSQRKEEGCGTMHWHRQGKSGLFLR